MSRRASMAGFRKERVLVGGRGWHCTYERGCKPVGSAGLAASGGVVGWYEKRKGVGGCFGLL